MQSNNLPPPLFRPNLESLIWPLTPEEFLGEYWNKQCFVSHGSRSRLSELTDSLDPNNVAKMIAESSSHSALRSHKKTVTPAFQPSRTALEQYESGDASLYIHLYESANNNPQLRSNTWKKWLIQISSELGRLNHTGKISVYASKKSLGLNPHFDPNDNYTIQLSGSKRWYYSNDAAFPAPDHTSGTAFRSGENLDKHLLSSAARYYVRDQQASRPPSKCESVVLEPGSMLYVPRGFWHWTESLETSISLNVSLFPGHWCNYFLPLIGQLLLKDPVWRETAHFGGASDMVVVEQLLGKLKSEIAYLKPTDVLPKRQVDKELSQISDDTQLRRRFLTQYFVLHSQNTSDHIDVLFVGIEGRPSTVKLPKHALKVLEWIENQRSPFSVAQLRKQLASIAPSLQKFIEELISANYLEINTGS